MKLQHESTAKHPEMIPVISLPVLALFGEVPGSLDVPSAAVNAGTRIHTEANSLAGQNTAFLFHITVTQNGKVNSELLSAVQLRSFTVS